jgi:ATP phosphoribosyltransferase
MNKIVQKHTLGNNNLQGVSIVCKKKHTLCTHLEGSSKEKTMTSEAKQVASNLRTLAKKNDIVVKVEYKKASWCETVTVRILKGTPSKIALFKKLADQYHIKERMVDIDTYEFYNHNEFVPQTKYLRIVEEF